jgi:hypothetical protein
MVGIGVVVAGVALAAGGLTRVSGDPFTNATSQHATEVEPDTFAVGSTVVAAFQAGRFFDGGASDIGYVRSTNGGSTWSVSGFLPGLTSTAGSSADPSSPFISVTDASVAYDARHGVWLISSVPLLPDFTAPTVFVSRSTNGGRTFGAPVQIPAPPVKKLDLDKNWSVCDNTPSSPHYGTCYTEFDNTSPENELLYMSTSNDGGLTWSTPIPPAGAPNGLGGQPVVQPNGTVIVPFWSLNGRIAAFRSTDGGQSWSDATTISPIAYHRTAGGLRDDPLPSAEIDGAGNVYVAWADCRFRKNCASNDIVLSTSSDGLSWTAPVRVPIDDVSSSVDHFLPGLGVDRATSGATAHLALTYYFYPTATCKTATCQLEVGFVSSPDGGAHWSVPTTLAGPMSLSDLAATSQGPMVGDYISTSFNASGTATTVFPIGLPHTGATFDEGMWAPSAPLSVTTTTTATNAASSASVQTLTGQALDMAAQPR